MNRRDLLTGAAATVAAAIRTPVEAQSMDIDASQQPVAFVVTSKAPLTEEAMANIRAAMVGAFKQTLWANVPVLVLDQGLQLNLVKWPEQPSISADEAERIRNEFYQRHSRPRPTPLGLLSPHLSADEIRELENQSQ